MTDFIKALCDAGGEVYVVGGAVRNFIYNCLHKTQHKIKDYDYLVRLIEIDKLISILVQYGDVKEVGKSFGVILLNPFNTSENIEFAIPRTEVSTGSGYKDFKITSDHLMSIQEDFSRRDATINAIGMRMYSLDDLSKLNVQNSYIHMDQFIDPYNGMSDIKFKIWRCVGDPRKRFNEDPTRIMRAFRQASELDLTISDQTQKSIGKDYILMKNLIPQSYVRIFNELIRTIVAPYNKQHLNKMADLGIFDFLGIKKYNKYTPDMLNKKSINRNDANLLIIKFALVVRPDEMEIIVKRNKIIDNIKIWANDRQISATNYLNSHDINVLIAIQSFSQQIKDIESLYDLLVVRKEIYKLVRGVCNDVLSNIITYLELSDQLQMEEVLHLILLLGQAHELPFSTDQLAFSGNDIMELLKCSGQKVGLVKEKLLDAVFSGKVKNDKDELMKYVIGLNLD
jgi:tRNA nucleotidyltransferase/poly(A) polymerase